MERSEKFMNQFELLMFTEQMFREGRSQDEIINTLLSAGVHATNAVLLLASFDNSGNIQCRDHLKPTLRFEVEGGVATADNENPLWARVEIDDLDVSDE